MVSAQPLFTYTVCYLLHAQPCTAFKTVVEMPLQAAQGANICGWNLLFSDQHAHCALKKGAHSNQRIVGCFSTTACITAICALLFALFASVLVHYMLQNDPIHRASSCKRELLLATMVISICDCRS